MQRKYYQRYINVIEEMNYLAGEYEKNIELHGREYALTQGLRDDIERTGLNIFNVGGRFGMKAAFVITAKADSKFAKIVNECWNGIGGWR